MRRSLSTLSILGLTALLATACGGPQVTDVGNSAENEVGGDDDDDGEPLPEPEGTFTIEATSAPLTMDLNVASTVNFTITPADGFTGTVTVTVPAHASGLTAESVNVEVTGAAPVSGSIDVETTTYKNVIPGAYTDIPLVATAGALSHQATFSATIRPILLLHIKAGAGNTVAAPDVWGADASGEGIIVHFGKDASGAPNNTFTISWINDDSVNHTIHAGGAANTHGIQHGDTNVNNGDVDGDPGNTQTRTLNRGGGALDPNDPNDEVVLQPNTFYCHNHLGTNLASGHTAKITLRN